MFSLIDFIRQMIIGWIVGFFIVFGIAYYLQHQWTIEREAELVAEKPVLTVLGANGEVEIKGSLYIPPYKRDLCKRSGGQILPRYKNTSYGKVADGSYCTVEMSVEQWNLKRGVTPEMIARVQKRSESYDFFKWLPSRNIFLDWIPPWFENVNWLGKIAALLVIISLITSTISFMCRTLRPENESSNPDGISSEQRNFSSFSREAVTRNQPVDSDTKTPVRSAWSKLRSFVIKLVLVITGIGICFLLAAQFGTI